MSSSRWNSRAGRTLSVARPMSVGQGNDRRGTDYPGRRSRRLATVLTAVLALLPSTGCPGLKNLLFPPPSAPKPTVIGLELVAERLTSPLGMAVPPDGSGRLFVLDQIGLIRIIDAAGNLLPEPFLDLSDRMVSVGIDFGGGFVFDERGLLGMAFHPGYATNGRFFVFYTAPKDPNDPADFNSETHVSEFFVSAGDPDRADPESERILLEIDKPQFNHNGGQLAFGPDGYLYISVGDGGGGGDVGVGHTPGLGNAQDASNLLGTILRIDVDGGEPFGIPPDNPFVGDADVRSEIWAYGLRNPWRFSFDSGGSRRLFCGDAGQDLFEEVSIIQKGGNYGWNIREGLHCFDPNAPGTPPPQCPDTAAGGEPLLDPIIEYPHFDDQGDPVGIVVIGGFVYRGSAIPGLHGDYVFADFSTSFFAPDGTLFAAAETADGDWQMRELKVADRPNGRIGRFILGFGSDAQGELYVLTSGNLAPSGSTGQVYRIVPAAETTQPTS